MKNLRKSMMLLLMSTLSIHVAYSQQVEVQGELKVTEMTTNDTQDNLVIRNTDGTLGTRSVNSLPPPPGPIDTARNLASDFALAKQLCDCPNLPPFMIRSLLESGYTEAELIEAGVSFPDIQNAEPILDGDGNVYSAIEIGTQTWLRENLNTTSTIDGNAITMGTASTWSTLGNNETAAYSYVNNLSTTANDYGLLYNWYVVETDDVCPLGYRVPNISDMQTMNSFLGAENAKLLKEKGFEFWVQPNQLSTNDSGFNLRGAGYRNEFGSYKDLKSRTRLWCTTEGTNINNARLGELWETASGLSTSGQRNKSEGSSIRCLKN